MSGRTIWPGRPVGGRVIPRRPLSHHRVRGDGAHVDPEAGRRVLPAAGAFQRHRDVVAARGARGRGFCPGAWTRCSTGCTAAVSPPPARSSSICRSAGPPTSSRSRTTATGSPAPRGCPNTVHRKLSWKPCGRRPGRTTAGTRTRSRRPGWSSSRWTAGRPLRPCRFTVRSGCGSGSGRAPCLTCSRWCCRRSRARRRTGGGGSLGAHRSRLTRGRLARGCPGTGPGAPGCGTGRAGGAQADGRRERLSSAGPGMLVGEGPGRRGPGPIRSVAGPGRPGAASRRGAPPRPRTHRGRWSAP